MKARILSAARKLFSEYGYDSTTTRMIAKEVGIDISTLYYHWGEKRDLYEAVLIDIDDEIRAKLKEIEKIARGKPVDFRLNVAIDTMCNYFFEKPEASNIIFFQYFGKTKFESDADNSLSEYISNVAVAMGLALDKQNITPHAKARVAVVYLTMLNFFSGEHFLRPLLNLSRDEYLKVIKETLRFILIPAFVNKPSQQNEEL
ncbi:MAG: TetR/AcrR family transcriptional regulator [Desulfobacterales bacterium]|nr:TetR/AcrR family transcriptional regulator [Desulfobacterales bacterium]